MVKNNATSAHNKKPSIVAIIPARGGSKGIPRKNIALLGSKPLIYYSIKAAQESKLIDEIIVSTDNKEIAGVAKKYGADVPFLRPAKFATDTSRDIEFLKHALDWLRKNRGYEPEIILFLQPTSPARTGKDIDSAISLMRKTGCDSVRTAAEEKSYHPLKTLVLSDEKSGRVIPVISLIPSLSSLGADVPRQLLPKMLRPVGIVYATKPKWIDIGRVWGDDVRYLPVSYEKITDIDVPEDLEKAEKIMRALKLLE